MAQEREEESARSRTNSEYHRDLSALERNSKISPISTRRSLWATCCRIFGRGMPSLHRPRIASSLSLGFGALPVQFYLLDSFSSSSALPSGAGRSFLKWS